MDYTLIYLNKIKTKKLLTMSTIKEQLFTKEINDSEASLIRIKWLVIGHVISWIVFGIIIIAAGGDYNLALLVNPGHSMTEADPIYIMVKLLSDTYIIWMFITLILTIIIMVAPRFENYQRPMLETLYASIFAGIFVESLKNINRVRPFDEMALINEFSETTDTGSMPSGHVGYSGAAVLPHAIRIKSIAVVIVIFLYNLGMMYTRMFLGVHYGTDVIVGNMISLGGSVMAFFLFELIYRKKELETKHKWGMFVLGVILFFVSQGIIRSL